MQDIATFLGGLVAFVALVSGAGYWLIQQWQAGLKQIEKMKEDRVQGEIREVKGIAQSARDTFRNAEIELGKVKERLSSLEARFDASAKNYDDKTKSLQQLSEKVLEFLNRPIDRSDAIPIGPETYILRKKAVKNDE